MEKHGEGVSISFFVVHSTAVTFPGVSEEVNNHQTKVMRQIMRIITIKPALVGLFFNTSYLVIFFCGAKVIRFKIVFHINNINSFLKMNFEIFYITESYTYNNVY